MRKIAHASWLALTLLVLALAGSGSGLACDHAKMAAAPEAPVTAPVTVSTPVTSPAPVAAPATDARERQLAPPHHRAATPDHQPLQTSEGADHRPDHAGHSGNHDCCVSAGLHHLARCAGLCCSCSQPVTVVLAGADTRRLVLAKPARPGAPQVRPVALQAVRHESSTGPPIAGVADASARLSPAERRLMRFLRLTL